MGKRWELYSKLVQLWRLHWNAEPRLLGGKQVGEVEYLSSTILLISIHPNPDIVTQVSDKSSNKR